MLITSDFDYPLPAKLIAQQPLKRRDASRLMVLNRANGSLHHHAFSDLSDLLCSGDLLVANDTQVIPAKFTSRRSTGGRIEGLFLKEISRGRWEVLLRGAGRCKPAEQLALSDDEHALELAENLGQGRWLVDLQPPGPAMDVLQQIGTTPLPPYIHREGTDSDSARRCDDIDRAGYQTIYAARPGAVAAPTAGLHFTDKVLADLARKQIEIAYVTLHVGLGTFEPVKTENLADHKMHAEWYELSAQSAEKINTARREGRRIIAVGTTSVRVLESAIVDNGLLRAGSGWTDIFIYPPAEFRSVDALITNFHLPRSTLLMLIAAFCSPGSTGGLQTILNAYAEAVSMRYRFFSYGDAMLIE